MDENERLVYYLSLMSVDSFPITATIEGVIWKIYVSGVTSDKVTFRIENKKGQEFKLAYRYTDQEVELIDVLPSNVAKQLGLLVKDVFLNVH